MACNPQSHGPVDAGQQNIQAHNPFFLAPFVNERGNQNGQNHIRQHAADENHGRQEGGLGFIENQQADGQIHGLSADGGQNGGGCDAGKILGP